MKNVIFLFLLVCGLSNIIVAQSDELMWLETQKGEYLTTHTLDEFTARDSFRIMSSNMDTAKNYESDWLPIFENSFFISEECIEALQMETVFAFRETPDEVILDEVIITSSSSVRFVVSYSGPSEGRWIRVNFGTVAFGVNEYNTISYWVEGTNGTFNIDHYENLVPGGSYSAKAFEHWPQIVDSEIKFFDMNFIDPCAGFSVMINCADLSFCEGSNLILTAVTQGGGNCLPQNFKWFKNGQSTSQTGSMITVTTGGVYTVEVTDENSCKATYSVIITVDPKPFAFIWSSIELGLKGDKVILMAQDNGMGHWLFDWSTGETTSTIIVDEVKTYTVTVTDSRTLCSAEASYGVPEIPKCEVKDTCSGGGSITVDFTINGSVHIPCGEGPWPTLSVQNVPDWSYLWHTGATTSSIVVKESGIYYLTVTVNGQNYAFEHYVQMFVGTPPIIITSPDTVYTCPGEAKALTAYAPGYENSQLITWSPYTNMTCLHCPNTVVAPTENTKYKATIQIGSCVYIREFWVLMKPWWECSGITDVDETEEEGNIVVFPNPVLHEGSVEMTGFVYGNYQACIFDALGKPVSNCRVFFTGDIFRISVSDLSLPGGIYTVLLKKDDGKIYVGRFTVL